MSDSPASKQETARPGEGRVILRNSSGDVVDSRRQLEKERAEEAQVNVNNLSEGDVIEFESGDHEKQTNFSFTVKHAEWSQLSIHSDAPQISLKGVISGLLDSNGPVEGYFSGSGWGGSMIQQGVIATGRTMEFFVPEKGVYWSPFVNFFDVKRRNPQGKLEPVSPNQLEKKPDPEITKLHEERLKKVEALMKKFGFDKDLKEVATHSDLYGLTSDDGRLFAKFRNIARGSELYVFDRDTDKFVFIKYHVLDDFLQIATSDFTGRKLDDDFPQIADMSNAYRAGAAITTSTTSQRYALNATHYVMSSEQAQDLFNLRVGTSGWPNAYRPNIVIGQDGQTSLEDDVEIGLIEEKQPGSKEKVKSAIKATVDGQNITLDINGANTTLPNPDSALDELSE